MRRALVVANLAGFASFLLNDIKLLKSKGYIVDFAANAEKLKWDDTKAAIEELGVPFYQIDFDSKNPFSKQNVKAYSQIKKLIVNKSYTLIHCHTPISGLVTRLAARKERCKGTKVLYTTHGFAFTSNSSCKSWLIYNTFERIGSMFCDAMITINKEDYENAKKMCCKNVFYINGVGVDTKKYSDVSVDRVTYRASLGIEKDKIMILSVGELSERKNHQIIIKAIGQLKNKGNIVYAICGNGINGGTTNMLKQLAKEYDVDLRLLGFRYDIPEITACSDIGAIPSVREGLGLAGIQSLAAGIPVVGTDVQGIRDYIIPGKTGFLCKAFDEKGFGEAIDKLICMNSSVKGKTREICLKTAQQFDINVSQKQMENIYRKLGVIE